MRVFFMDSEPESLQFSVIAAQFDGKWIYVRHRERDTFEIPGGHIEPGESSFEAAVRELEEETGAVDFTLYPLKKYAVERDGMTTYGELFYADVTKLGDLPDFEMAERLLCSAPPAAQTYPAIQPMLFEYVCKWLG